MPERTIDVKIMEVIEQYITELYKKYDIEAVYLFGSYVKGTNNENSNIDIAVILKSEKIHLI